MDEQLRKVCDPIYSCISSLDISTINLKDFKPHDAKYIRHLIAWLREHLDSIESGLLRNTYPAATTDAQPTVITELTNSLLSNINDQLNRSAKQENNDISQDNDNLYVDIIMSYESDPTKVRVNPTKNSLLNFNDNVHNGLILEKNQNGDFWIIEVNNKQLLFPARDFKISKHNIDVVRHFFKGEGFDYKVQNQFSVLEPAVVKTIDRIEWELQKQGELAYTK